MNYRLWVLIFCVLILVLTTENTPADARNKLQTLHSYANTLYNENLTFTENALRLQYAFCPDQTYCSENATRLYINGAREDSFDTLHDPGNETLSVDKLQGHGVCCIACSCEDSCFIDGNCCLEKVMGQMNQTNQSMVLPNVIRRECIAATVESYNRIPFLSSKTGSYLMVTECFLDRLNETLLRQCEQPNFYNIQEAYPVTSLSSGTTYWNYFCAICNHDTDSLVDWTISVSVIKTIHYFSNGSIHWMIADTFEGIYKLLVDLSAIEYRPPMGVDTMECVHKTATKRCLKPNIHTLSLNHTFIQDACATLYSPVIIEQAYANIFCFLCQAYLFHPNSNVNGKCTTTDTVPKGLGQSMITGLIDFRGIQMSTDDVSDFSKLDFHGCSCAQVYDKYLVSSLW